MKEEWSLWECTRVQGCGPKLWARFPLTHKVICWNCYEDMTEVSVSGLVTTCDTQ
jgi:hypothetical protein